MNTKYEDLMNSREIVQVKVGDKLQKGQLIGYCSSTKDPNKISVAYPYFSPDPYREGVFNFVLYENNGKPVLDNDGIRDGDRNPVYTNVEPIIVPVGGNTVTTLHDELSEIFTTPYEDKQRLLKLLLREAFGTYSQIGETEMKESDIDNEFEEWYNEKSTQQLIKELQK